VKNKIPMFGMKEHAAVDVESGLVLSTHVSKASEHDTNYFRYVVMKGIHGKQCRPSMPTRDTVEKPIGNSCA